MNCNEARGLLWPERDGELTPEMRDVLVRHRRSCEECRQAADDLDRISRKLAIARQVTVPPRLESRLLLRARAGSVAPRRVPVILRSAAAILAGVSFWLALSLAWRAFLPSRPPLPSNLSESSLARHLTHTLSLLESGALPGVRDPLFEASPELRLLASLRAKKGADR